LLNLINLGGIPWPDPEKHGIYISEEMQSFITSLLHKEPFKRLGAQGVKKIINHPWFDDIDFQTILDQEMEPPYLPHIEPINEEDEENRCKSFIYPISCNF